MRRYAVMLLILGMGTMSRADEKGDRMAEVVRGNNQFAFDLYARLRDQPGNIFLSPYSISTALAMTYAGARGETAEQMGRTLHFTVPPEQLHGTFGSLVEQINGLGEDRPYRLSVANALWGQQGERFLPRIPSAICR